MIGWCDVTVYCLSLLRVVVDGVDIVVVRVVVGNDDVDILIFVVNVIIVVGGDIFIVGGCHFIVVGEEIVVVDVVGDGILFSLWQFLLIQYF